MASRAWWVLLLAMGPLVGVSFISAVRTYAEASGLNGTAAGVGEAFSPLVGIWAPTFSACELAAVFLLPFVAIRLVSGDRQSGALKLELQHPMPAFARDRGQGAGAAGGLAGRVAGAAGGGRCCGKATAAASTRRSWRRWSLGHLLNAGLTIALAAAAASVTEHPSTAAILTLSVTVGTWILNFIAAVQGGIWERAAGYTPPAMVAEFQHGLIRLDVVADRARAGRCWAWRSPRSGCGSASPVRRRVYESVGARRAVAVLAMLACSARAASWDLSENRDELVPRGGRARRSRQIRAPLRIEVHLAPEDPRRVDLERKALAEAAARAADAAGAVRVGDVDRPVRADQRRTTARSGTSSAAARR